MDIAAIQSGTVGMALFDLWDMSVRKAHKHDKIHGSPLVAAAADAFEAYIGQVEVQYGAELTGLATYALNPQGTSATLITQKDIAPFLALNLMA